MVTIMEQMEAEGIMGTHAIKPLWACGVRGPVGQGGWWGWRVTMGKGRSD